MSEFSMNEHIKNGFAFEEFIYKLFLNMELDKIEKNVIFKDDLHKYRECDMIISHGDIRYAVEVKYYLNNQSLRGKLLTASKHLIEVSSDRYSLILICANLVEDDLKSEIKTKYKIEIIDIRNLLWMTQNNDILFNELVSLLNYSVQNIIRQEIVLPFIIKSKMMSVEDKYIERLKKMKSGKTHFSDYEKLCVDILKYIFSEDLRLWKTQTRTNNDLYRFDLCCKVKFGEVGEFFDTVREFFNTRYIVFEFKNYKEKISQKEIYTTEKYLYATALRSVAIIISREGENVNAGFARKGCLRENGKLIICLSDNDLINMIKIKSANGEQTPAGYLTDILDDMLLTLEK